MRYKQQIITRLDSTENTLNTLIKQVSGGMISGEEAIKQLELIKKRLKDARHLVHLESQH